MMDRPEDYWAQMLGSLDPLHRAIIKRDFLRGEGLTNDEKMLLEMLASGRITLTGGPPDVAEGLDGGH